MPQGDWAENPLGDSSAEERSPAATAVDDAVPAPGLEVQDHYGFEEADQATSWNLGSHQNEMGYLGGTNARRLSVEHDFGTQYELRSPLGLAYTEIDSDMVDPADSRVSYIHTPDGELIGTADSSQGARYVITDHQNTVVGVFSTGEPAGSIAYDAWGNEISRTGDLLAIGYAGGETGSPTGLIKFGARYYDPALGVFTQMDPAGQEHNPYTYAAADPINNIDPTGLDVGYAAAIGLLGVSSVGFAAGLMSTPLTGGASTAAAVSLGASAIGKYGSAIALGTAC